MSGTSNGKSNNADAYVWIGASGGSWGTAANWTDTVAASGPAVLLPGTLTPVTIAGAIGSTFSVITGGGSAASVAVSGNVSASGNYAIGGALSIGAATSSSGLVTYKGGALALASAGTLAVGSIALASGALSIATGGNLTAAGPITIGSAGKISQTGGLFIIDNGASGTVGLASGATLSAGGPLLLAQGTLTIAGATANVAGPLAVGTAATPSTNPSYTNGSYGVLAVTAGGTLTVADALGINAGIVVVAGAGSKLLSTKTLTASVGGFFYSAPNGVVPTAYSGALAVASGGSARFGGIVLTAPASTSIAITSGAPNISVDAISSIEIGNLGNAVSGALTIDAGKAVTANTSATISGNVIDNGTIIASAGILTIAGNLSGTGIVQVGKNATLQINGIAAATGTIAFTDTAAALSIGSSLGSFNPLTSTVNSGASYVIAATIAGMQAGDSILVGQTVTSASYAATTSGRGTLTLRNGTAVVETLTLAGIGAGQSFLVSPTTQNGSAISMLAPAPATPGTKSPSADAYSWIGASGGSWATAANWKDTAAAATGPAVFMPGTLTPVTIAGTTGSAYSVIAGGGSAASIAVSGNVSASGLYTIGGALSIGTAVRNAGAVGYTSGTFALGATGTLAAGSITLASGTLTAGAGDRLTASGSISIGSAGNISQSGSIFATDSGAASAVSLGAGATLTVGGALMLAQGALTVGGGIVSIAGPLTVGTAATPSTNPSYTYGANGTLAITAGGTLTVADALGINAGIVVVAGAGSKLLSTRTLTAGVGGSYYSATAGAFPISYSGALAAASGGSVQLGGILLSAPTTSRFVVTPDDPGISIDATSSIEIGNLGSAAAGALTIDAGKAVTANTSATISGNVIDNGTIVANAGTLTIAGNLSGTGIVQVGKNATLQINGIAAATGTIAFTDTAAALSIGSSLGSFNPQTSTVTPGAPYGIAATIAGMQAGDSILVGQTVTSATYAATTSGRGTLTLRNGTAVVETLTLAGIGAGQSFLVSPTTQNGSAISLVNRPPQLSGTAAAATFAAGSGSGVALAPALTITAPASPTLTGATIAIGSSTLTPGDVLAATTAGSAITATYNATTGVLSLSGKDTLAHYQAVLASATYRSTSANPTVAGNAPTRDIAWTINDGIQASSPFVSLVQVSGGARFTLTSHADTITGTAYDDTIAATSATLNSKDQINGGPGANTLQLTGVGVFDLGAPKMLINVRAVAVTESAQETVVYLRDGLTLAVTVASSGGGITIYGGQDSSTINLGNGSDTVILGSAAESVTGGGGTALVQATAVQAAALVNGGSGATTLEIIGGGAANLHAATTHVAVQLDAATNLTLGKLGFITVLGSAGNDTITALAGGQTMTGGAGSDTLIGYSGFGDTFIDTAAGLNGDLIQMFGGSDQIDITDLKSSAASLSYTANGGAGTLNLTDGTHPASIRLQGSFTASKFHMAADGHGGTLVTYAA